MDKIIFLGALGLESHVILDSQNSRRDHTKPGMVNGCS